VTSNRQFLIPVFALAVLLFTTISSQGQDLGETISQPGLFSYQAPKGWAIKSLQLSKFPIAADAPRNNFSANINVVVEPAPGSLADYVALNKKLLVATPMFTHFQIVDEQSFETSAGVKGVRLVTNDGLGKEDMQQIFYFFEGSSNNKFVVTGSSLAADGDHYAPVFNASLKTFSPQ
jgi:hypothetical protein